MHSGIVALYNITQWVTIKIFNDFKYAWFFYWSFMYYYNFPNYIIHAHVAIDILGRLLRRFLKRNEFERKIEVYVLADCGTIIPPPQLIVSGSVSYTRSAWLIGYVCSLQMHHLKAVGCFATWHLSSRRRSRPMTIMLGRMRRYVMVYISIANQCTWWLAMCTTGMWAMHGCNGLVSWVEYYN